MKMPFLNLNREQAKKLGRFYLPFFCLFLCFLVLLQFIRPIRVVGKSMTPSLHSGQLLIGIHHWKTIKRGDIVVASTGNELLIKRVIALPNERIRISDGKVYINSNRLTESYIKEPMNTDESYDVVLGENEYFLMGDNRNESGDSRLYGPFGSDAIQYKIYGK